MEALRKKTRQVALRVVIDSLNLQKWSDLDNSASAAIQLIKVSKHAKLIKVPEKKQTQL